MCWRPVATPSPCVCQVQFASKLQSSLAQRAGVTAACGTSCSCPCSLRAGQRCPRGPALLAAGCICSRLRYSLCSSDTTMTVRRYSTAASAPAPPGTRPHRAGKRPPSSGLPEVRGRAQLPACPSAAQHAGDEGKGLGKTPANCFSSSSSNKMKLFQEHVRRCR